MNIPKYSKTCPEGMFQKIIETSDSQNNRTETIRLCELAKMMENLTEEHLDRIGMSQRVRQEEGKAWVIAWNSIFIQRMPKRGEKIDARIWPGKRKSVMSSRKYAFYTAEGEPLVGASALYVLMDVKNRSMAQPSEALKNLPVVMVEGEPALPGLSIPFPEVLSQKKERTVKPQEIDKNGHMNNTCYLDWIEELLDGRFLQNYTPQTVWIQYNKELLEGQTATLNYELQNNTLFVRGYSETTESFSLKIQCS